MILPGNDVPMKKAVLLFLSGLLCLSCQSQSKRTHKISDNSELQVSDHILTDALKLAYIGNMGVLFEYHDKTVIIDGLHQYYNKQYLYPTEEIVNELITGTFKDFTNIEASMFTHVHGDHFSERYALRLLENNADAIVLGSQQIRDSIARLTHNSKVLSAIETVPYDGNLFRAIHKGIDITAIKCDHSSPSRHGQIKNIAYVVDLDGFKLLHIGDTDWELTKKPFTSLNLASSKIDLAVIPYWMLLEQNAYETAMETIAAKHIIATHIPPNFSTNDRDRLHERFANITILTTLGEVQYFKRK